MSDEKAGLVGRTTLFVRQVVAELRKVVWPTRNQVTTYTTVVLVFVALIGAIVSGFDLGFTKLILLVFG